MEKDFSINEEGYSVRCRLFHQGHARTFKRVVICTHGFGNNKDKPNITRFSEKEFAKYKNDAVLAFDWPCHGQDARKKLELDECMKISYLRGKLLQKRAEGRKAVHLFCQLWRLSDPEIHGGNRKPLYPCGPSLPGNSDVQTHAEQFR